MSDTPEPQNDAPDSRNADDASTLSNESLEEVAGGIVGPGGCIPPFPWEPSPTFPEYPGLPIA